MLLKTINVYFILSESYKDYLAETSPPPVPVPSPSPYGELSGEEGEMAESPEEMAAADSCYHGSEVEQQLLAQLQYRPVFICVLSLVSVYTTLRARNLHK